MKSTAALIAAAALALAETKMPEPAKLKVEFDKHVQPILAAKCHSCHGSKQQQSGLRLDKRQNALRGGDYGPVIVQGNSLDSKLIKKLVSGDGGMQMPPTGALEQDEIAILRAWIDQGADFGEIEIKEEAPKPVDPKLAALISAVRSRDAAAIKKTLRTPGVVKMQDAAGSTALHHAAGFGTLDAMKKLLDAGSDPNARNRHGATPLHWAVANNARIGLLLSRGADVNAQTNDGRTALYMAAMQRSNDGALRLLLDKGADPALATTGGRTPLMAAAGFGAVDSMKALLDRRADPNAISGSNSTPLMDAAVSRSFEAARLLVERGANVNARTKRNQTALAMAATYGSTETVKLLLDKGADVNIRDERGYSALMYAAYSEWTPVEIVKMLLDKGAARDVTGEGETPKSLAAKRGDTEVARLLGVAEDARRKGGIAAGPVQPAGRNAAQAVEKALEPLAAQSPNFVKRGGCNSCHNQYLPSAATAIARQRGIRAPEKIVQLSSAMTERTAERAMDFSVAAVNSLGYELFGYAAHGMPANEYTASVARYVKSMQTAEGSWQTTGHRPPLTSDDFWTTALAMYALRVYGPAPEKADNEQRLARAARWLESAAPATTQERASQLMGLVWAKAPAAAIDKSARGLIESQRSDGGWAQLPKMGSDAYAAGMALYALQIAGRADAGVRAGLQYLLRTQAADGTWHIRTRSLPLQPYFESGFPYGHDQWISAAGTSWAAMALSLSVEPARMSRR